MKIYPHVVAQESRMVFLHVKSRESSLFLLDTKLELSVDETLKQIAQIQNGRLKVLRVCSEIEELSKHGTIFPPEMLGLLPEQISELKLVDENEEKCIPSGGVAFNADPVGRRNGRAPVADMKQVLLKTVAEAKAKVSAQNVSSNTCLTFNTILEALDILRGAVSIVYPMGLPDYDPIRMEFENREELGGTQAEKEVVDLGQATLWFSSKELMRGKKLKDFLGGANEKSKVIVKLSTRSAGQPARESVLSEEDQKRLLQADYKRREELARLERDADDSHLNSPWADQQLLKRRMNGLSDVSWRPK